MDWIIAHPQTGAVRIGVLDPGKLTSVGGVGYGLSTGTFVADPPIPAQGQAIQIFFL